MNNTESSDPKIKKFRYEKYSNTYWKRLLIFLIIWSIYLVIGYDSYTEDYLLFVQTQGHYDTSEIRFQIIIPLIGYVAVAVLFFLLDYMLRNLNNILRFISLTCLIFATIYFSSTVGFFSYFVYTFITPITCHTNIDF